jgi:hypothetical protein
VVHHHLFLWSALRDGLHTHAGLSPCQFLATLHADHVHPGEFFYGF